MTGLLRFGHNFANARPNKFKAHFVLGENLKCTLGLDRCPIIGGASSVASVFSNLASLEQEVIVAGALDCKCRLLFWNILATGSSDRVHLRTGDAFYGAVKTHACAIFLIHNHPSGSLVPSTADIDLTRHVAEAGLMFGYPLLDHVIISSKGHVSLMSPEILKERTHLADLTPAYAHQASEPALNVNWTFTCP